MIAVVEERAVLSFQTVAAYIFNFFYKQIMGEYTLWLSVFLVDVLYICSYNNMLSFVNKVEY